MRDRGPQPFPDFDLYALADTVELRPVEVAVWRRYSLSYVERCRREKTDGLDWKIINNRPRTTVGSLKEAIAAATVKSNTAPDFRADEKKYVPPKGKRRTVAGTR